MHIGVKARNFFNPHTSPDIAFQSRKKAIFRKISHSLFSTADFTGTGYRFGGHIASEETLTYLLTHAGDRELLTGYSKNF